MDPPEGTRAALDSCFVTLFNAIHVTQQSDDSLHHIFSTISSNHVCDFNDDIQHVYKSFTDGTIALYTYIVAKLPTTPPKFHYLFNIRDLSRVIERLCKVT